MIDRDAIRLEIEERNALRREAHLPLLNPERELERLLDVAEEQAFDAWLAASPLYQRAMRMGASHIERHDHRPRFMFGMALGSRVRCGMWKRWERRGETD